MNKTKIERIREYFQMGIPSGVDEITEEQMMNIIDNTLWGAMIKLKIEWIDLTKAIDNTFIGKVVRKMGGPK